MPLFQRSRKGVQVKAVCLYSECQSGKLVDAIRHDKWHNGRMVKEEKTGQSCFAAPRRLGEMLRISRAPRRVCNCRRSLVRLTVDVRPLAVQEDGYSTEDEPPPFDEQCKGQSCDHRRAR